MLFPHVRGEHPSLLRGLSLLFLTVRYIEHAGFFLEERGALDYPLFHGTRSKGAVLRVLFRQFLAATKAYS